MGMEGSGVGKSITGEEGVCVWLPLLDYSYSPLCMLLRNMQKQWEELLFFTKGGKGQGEVGFDYF